MKEFFKKGLPTNRQKVFFLFIGMSIYWGLVLTWPALVDSGSLSAKGFMITILLPIFGLIMALAALNKKTTIYDTISKGDRVVLLMVGMFGVFFPAFLSLHDVFQIEIPDAILPIAWFVSLSLMIAIGCWFYFRLRKEFIGGGSILLSIFGSGNGLLLGMILFKLYVIFWLK